MSMVPVADSADLRAPTGQTPQPDVTPGINLIGGAAFRQANSVVSILQDMKNAGPFQPEGGYSALPDIKGTSYFDNHPDRFAASGSRAETDSIKRQIDQEEADRRTLHAAGGLGVVASMVAGTLDPTMLLPGRVAIGAAKEGAAFVRGAREVGAAMAVQSTVQEAALQASQETRTPGESVMNVGSATLLGALLGGTAMSLLHGSGRASVADAAFYNDRADMASHIDGSAPAVALPPSVSGAPPLIQEAVAPAPSFAAYHGSPHMFGEFNADRIGTGEGAQGYGHGLYFAENSRVAADYQKKLSNEFDEAAATADPEFGPRLKAAQEASRQAAAERGAFKKADADGSLSPDEGIEMERVTREAAREAEADLDALYKEASEKFPGGGTLYQVRIHADRDAMLDWDKPLSEQPPNVQAAISELSKNKEVASRIESLGASASMERIYGAIGRGLTHSMWRGAGAVGAKADAAASEALRDAGVPGIKYLDQGSRRLTDDQIRAEIASIKADAEKARQFGQRAAPHALGPTDAAAAIARLEAQIGQPFTRNFVVFNDKDVRITHVNGERVPGAERYMPSPPLAPGGESTVGAATSDTRRLDLVPTGIGLERAGVFAEGDKAFVQGAPRENYIRDISTGDIDLPTTHELNVAINSARDADRKYSIASGMKASEYDRLVQLNRMIDNGSDVAIAEKGALLNRLPPGKYTLDLADEGQLKQLHAEFSSLERQGGEGLEVFEDGIARVLKRYVSDFTRGDDFARAVFRKAFVEAREHGFDTRKLGNDVIDRFLSELSEGDRAFMREEFAQFTQKKLPAAEGGGDRVPSPNASAQSPIGEGGGVSTVGAATADTRRLDLVPTGIGLERAPLDPMSRNLNSPSLSVRRATVDLAEPTGRFQENLEGIPTTQGPSVDRLVRMATNQTKVAVGAKLDDLWKGLRFAGADAPWFAKDRDAMGMLDRPPELPKFDEFKAMVSDALRNGDKHDIPQVQEAAQFLRAKVFEPWKERAIKAGLLPEGVDTKTADSYLQRLYNKQAITAQRPEFTNVVQSWLEGDQATKAAAKDRIGGHARQLEMAEKRIAELEASAEKLPQGNKARADLEYDIRRAGETRDQIRANIEDEIRAWEGKSSGPAKSALKARAKAEEGRAPEAPRLRAADPEVDAAVRRIIESDRDLTGAELRDRAHQIVERILGSPDGRLPYDEAMGGPQLGPPSRGEAPRGPLAAREFNIPDAQIAKWLENDIEHIVSSHLRTMVPDVLLAERFGDVAMTESFRKIEDDFARLIDGTKSEAARTKLGKQREAAIRDLAAIRDRVRGVYGMDVMNSMRGAARVAAAVKNYNVIASMGMATVSSLPDIAGATFRHGLGNVFRDAYVPFARFLMGGGDEWKQAAKQFRAMGIATESVIAQRHHALSDIMENYRPQSRLERTLQFGADKMQFANMLAPWTDWGKINASMVAGAEILRAAKAATERTATKRQIAQLAESGIDGHMAEKIHAEFSREGAGEVINGVHLPNTDRWQNRPARDAFEGAVSREADIAIVTPGQEKPLWLSNPLVSVIGQFKSFTAAATQRILIANLQRADAQVLQGVMFSMGLGMVSYKLNSILGGQPTSDKPQDWIKEAISRGSLLGWLEEGNALTSKMTRGRIDMYRLIGTDKPLSRYAGRSVLDQMLGPTAGKVESLAQITGAAASRDWNESDTRAVHKLTAFGNLFWLRNAFNQVEIGANNAFGIPMKAPTQH